VAKVYINMPKLSVKLSVCLVQSYCKSCIALREEVQKRLSCKLSVWVASLSHHSTVPKLDSFKLAEARW